MTLRFRTFRQFLLGTVLLGSLRAGSITVPLDIPDNFITGSPIGLSAPWGQLDLTLNQDQSVLVVVTPSSSLFRIGWVDFNINGSFAGLAVSGLPGGWTANFGTPGNPWVIDSVFGPFDAHITGSGNIIEPGGFIPYITFTLSRDGGFASVSDLVRLSQHSPNVPVAFSVELVQDDQPNATKLHIVGGVPGINPVPEPSTQSLVGLSALLFVSYRILTRRGQTPR